MYVRLIPYEQVFVGIQLDLDEAAELSDLLAQLEGRAPELELGKKLRQRLEDALNRADALMRKKK